MKETVEVMVLPSEVMDIAKNVSVDKRTEVQTVLNQVFSGVEKMREKLNSVVVSDANDIMSMKIANTIRLEVRRVRLNAEDVFDLKRSEVQLKMLDYKTEDSLWLKAKQIVQILTKEVEALAKYKEDTKDRYDAELREMETQRRMVEVAKYSDIHRAEYEYMSEASFQNFVIGLKTVEEAKMAAAKKAEEDRVAAIQAQAAAVESQRIENEQMKVEAIKRAKELEAITKANAIARDKAKAEADRIQAETVAKFKAESIAKAQKAHEELQQIKIKNDALVKAELQREQEALELIEAIKKEELAAQLEESLARKQPLQQRLSSWVNSFEIPYFEGDCTKDLALGLVEKDIMAKFEEFKKWSLKQIDK